MFSHRRISLDRNELQVLEFVRLSLAECTKCILVDAAMRFEAFDLHKKTHEFEASGLFSILGVTIRFNWKTARDQIEHLTNSSRISSTMRLSIPNVRGVDEINIAIYVREETRWKCSFASNMRSSFQEAVRELLEL